MVIRNHPFVCKQPSKDHTSLDPKAYASFGRDRGLTKLGGF